MEFFILTIVTRKEIVWIHGPFSHNFGIMLTIAGWSFTEGQIFFKELEAGDSIEGILAVLDNNMLIAIASAERFRD